MCGKNKRCKEFEELEKIQNEISKNISKSIEDIKKLETKINELNDFCDEKKVAYYKSLLSVLEPILSNSQKTERIKNVLIEIISSNILKGVIVICITVIMGMISCKCL